VIGMPAYNWSGGTTVLMLAIGALVYFGTMGYQQWRASSR
jgi:cytochrome c-type biogenesis protein CcmH/NrfG